MEEINSSNIDNFFYRVCWYHKILKQVLYGSWNKFNLKKENDTWLVKQNKKYPECYYWMEGYILERRENYTDLVRNKDKIYKNLEYFKIKKETVEIIDISENVVERFFYLNSK